jgi:hypothetical protein
LPPSLLTRASIIAAYVGDPLSRHSRDCRTPAARNSSSVDNAVTSGTGGTAPASDPCLPHHSTRRHANPVAPAPAAPGTSTTSLQNTTATLRDHYPRIPAPAETITSWALGNGLPHRLVRGATAWRSPLADGNVATQPTAHGLASPGLRSVRWGRPDRDRASADKSVPRIGNAAAVGTLRNRQLDLLAQPLARYHDPVPLEDS